MTASSSTFEAMSLQEIEEVSGELHRRAGVALRRIGELKADQLLEGGPSARQQIAALVTAIELAGATLAALTGHADPPPARSDRHPSQIAAVMYAAPTIAGLLTRLEQDRRMLTSLTRHLEPRLDEPVVSAWGAGTIRQLVIELSIAEPARVAQALESAIPTLLPDPPEDAAGPRDT